MPQVTVLLPCVVGVMVMCHLGSGDGAAALKRVQDESKAACPISLPFDPTQT